MKIKYRVWHKGKMWYPDGDEEFLIDMDGELLCIWEVEDFGALYERNYYVPDAIYMLSLDCLDRNGRKIYAGDALKWPHQKYHYVVEWCPQDIAYMLFVHGHSNSPFNTLGKEIRYLKPTEGLPEIIGNRYENPDLADKSWTSE